MSDASHISIRSMGENHGNRNGRDDQNSKEQTKANFSSPKIIIKHRNINRNRNMTSEGKIRMGYNDDVSQYNE